MKTGLYPKLTLESIRRNGRLYLPYYAAGALMTAVFYVMHFLGWSDVMSGMAGGSTAVDMMKIGTYIVALFGGIFLFYTQSTLLKNRKKEFALYSILGMNRANIRRIILCDNFVSWAVSLALGLALGIGLSGLATLGFTRLIAVPTKYKFSISLSSVGMTALTFSVVFLLLYLNSVRQIQRQSTVELMRAENAGEKPPRSNWVLGIAGLVFLGAGYAIALKIQQPMSALMYFFVAVILVIIGTYLLMITGSVLLCRLLQKNKRYYYKTKHFVSVSSLSYRMKRNGASLASICILLTAVLVMLSSTSTLYIDSDKCLDTRYPNEIGAFACKYGYDERLVPLGERLDAALKETAEEYGATVTNNRTYYEYSISGYFENSKLDVTLNSKSNLAFINYDSVAQILFIDVEDYNRVFGYNESVGKGQALVGTAKNIDIGGVITIGDVPFEVTGRIDERVAEIDPAAAGSACPGIFVIVNDVQEVATHYTQYKDYDGEPMLAWFWNCAFDTGLDEQEQIQLAQRLDERLKAELDGLEFDNAYCESHEGQRGDFVSSFGGLFFLGILLSAIFLVSCVVIIYYKQISEGFEDASRYGIMQKVGMTDEDIKQSINSQMLTVFFAPVGFACLHILAVLPIVNKLLMLFGLFDYGRLLLMAALCVGACALFYSAVYKLTSRTYYKIVH